MKSTNPPALQPVEEKEDNPKKDERADQAQGNLNPDIPPVERQFPSNAAP